MLPYLMILAISTVNAQAGGPKPSPASCLMDDDLSLLRVDLSADGKFIAGAGGTRTGGDWKIFDLSTGKCSVDGTSGNQRCWGAFGVSMSGDGSLVAVGGNGRSLYVADAASGKLRWDLSREGHLGVVRDLLFTPDAKFLISGASDMTIRVWDLQNKKAHAVFRFDSTNPQLKRWTPDGAERAKHVHDIEGKYVYLGRIALAPDGKTLALGGNVDGKIPLVDLATGKVVKAVALKQPKGACVQFTKDGKWLVVGGAPPNGAVEIWDLEKGDIVTTFGKHESGIKHIAVSPDKKTVATGGTGDGFRVWDVATGKQKFSYFTPDDPRMPRMPPEGAPPKAPYIQKEGCSAGVAFLPDGKTFLIAPHWTLWKTEIYFHDTATCEPVDFREAVKRLPAQKK